MISVAIFVLRYMDITQRFCSIFDLAILLFLSPDPSHRLGFLASARPSVDSRNTEKSALIAHE